MLSSKTVLINSENRTSGTSSDFTYHIPNDGNHTHCCVLGLNIPVSYYLIQQPYNVFILRELDTNTEISIPEGNYNVNSFRTTVIQLLNTKSPNGWTYNITFANDYISGSIGKYTFTVAPFTNPPSIIFPDNSELHVQFGFAHASTNILTGGSLESTSVVSFIPETVLTISSDLCEDRNLFTVFHNNTIPFSNIIFQCQSEIYSKKLRSNGKDTIYNFTLTNRNGLRIDTNGMPILLNLLFFTPNDRYKRDIQDYIKYRITK